MIMVWLAVVVLAYWLVIERSRLSVLVREVERLAREVDRLGQEMTRAVSPPAPPRSPAEDAAAVAQTMAALASAVDFRQPLPEPAIPPAAPEAAAPHEARPSLRPTITRAAIEAWVSEKGLAWIGGSALVVGGAFLVGYAVQRGFFTPQMRIAAACMLGVLMLGAGEVIRRRPLAGFGGHKLAAAILTGAGAAVLYGSTWAASSLYGFISAPVCAGLLAAIATSVMALAFLHGEALAMLALGGGFIAPLIAGRGGWSFEATTLYLGILVMAGCLIGWLRRWPATIWTNLAGALIWSLLADAGNDGLKCALIGLEPLAIMVILAYAWPRRIGGRVGLGAVLTASFAVLGALANAYAGPHPETVGLLAGIAAPLLVAALLRRGQAPAWSLAAPGVAFTLALIRAQADGGHDATLTLLWCAQILALTAADLWATWAEARRQEGGAGALSALALGLLAAAGLTASPLASVGPLVACAALSLGALRLSTDRARPCPPRTLEIWSGAAAAALLTAVAAGLSWRWAAFGFAAAAAALAIIGGRLGRRMVMAAAAVGGSLAFATLLTPGMLGYGLSGGGGAGWYLAMGLVVAAVSFVAARLVVSEPGAAEALRTLSPLAALVGGCVFLRWAAGAHGALPLSPLTEASIRTFLIADAGLVGLAGLSRTQSRFAHWRAYALMAAAALHGLAFQVLVFNPRWSTASDPIGGIVLLNSLAAAYLAPALVFGVGSARAYRSDRRAGRAYALIAVLSGLLWAFLEIRRAFEGSDLGGGPLTVSPGEALGCSLVLLAVAAVADKARVLAGRTDAHPLWNDTARSLMVGRGVATGFTLFMAGLWSNPCWGPAASPFAGVGALAAGLTGYGLATLMISRLSLDAARAGKRVEAEIQAVGAIAMGVLLASLTVRALFHGADLVIGGQTSEIENWCYSAVWAVIGLGFIGASRRGRLFLRAGLALLLVTTAKVFVLDTASLSGVVRAGSFLALGVLLLLGALTARRIAQGSAPPSSATVPGDRDPDSGDAS
jgi:uncharacterized membrane protein